jgi:O-methyltransferase
VTKYGFIENVRFVKGFFDYTMPGFSDPVAAAYIDVDLASSTKTCLKCIWPLLSPGGLVFSQDAHLPLVVDVLKDRAFWNDELRSDPPHVVGLGEQQLVWFTKPIIPSVRSAAKVASIDEESHIQ